MRMIVENDHAAVDARRQQLERLTREMVATDPEALAIQKRIAANASKTPTLTYHQQKTVRAITDALFACDRKL